MKLLVVNAGSSSLKYQLFDTADYTVAAKGICERIGQAVGVLEHKNLIKGTRTKKDLVIPTHTDAVRIVIDALTDAEIGVISDMAEIEAVLANPGKDDDIMELTRAYLENKRELDFKMEEWEKLSEQLDQ